MAYGSNNRNTSRGTRQSQRTTTRQTRNTSPNQQSQRQTNNVIKSPGTYRHQGQTTFDFQHNHTYGILNKYGDGWTDWAVHPQEPRIKHRHQIQNNKVIEAASECWYGDINYIDSCENLYGVSGLGPHIHKLVGFMSDRSLQKIRKNNIVAELRNTDIYGNRTSSNTSNNPYSNMRRETSARYYYVSNNKPYFGEVIETNGKYYTSQGGTHQGNARELKRKTTKNTQETQEQETQQEQRQQTGGTRSGY